MLIYLYKVQFTCEEKIKNSKNLNLYETFCALQTHTSLWLFGWIIEPSTAYECFNKQFHIYNPIYNPLRVPEDDVVIEAKKQLLNGTKKKVHLTWNKYTTRASIFLNGSDISLFADETGNYFLYTIPCDYKPGIIKIHNIIISETVFDYLENKGLLSAFTRYKLQKIE